MTFLAKRTFPTGAGKRPPPILTGMPPTTCAAHPPATQALATRQHGVGMTGFLLSALPILWLGLGGIELARWMQLRQSLSLVLMDSVREGTTRQADPSAMAQAFEHGLRKIYPAAGETERVLHERRQALGRPWHILIQTPTAAAFSDHSDPHLLDRRAYRGQALIRNDRQAQQHETRVAQGWDQGRGPLSGLTIFEANTLKVSLQWPHRPLVPGVGALIRTLAPLAQDPDRRRWMAAGYLPFQRHAALAMQSPPAAWLDLPDGRVTHATGARSTSSGPPGGPTTSTDDSPSTGKLPDAPSSSHAEAPRNPDDHAGSETDQPSSTETKGRDATPSETTTAESCEPV